MPLAIDIAIEAVLSICHAVGSGVGMRHSDIRIFSLVSVRAASDEAVYSASAVDSVTPLWSLLCQNKRSLAYSIAMPVLECHVSAHAAQSESQ